MSISEHTSVFKDKTDKQILKRVAERFFIGNPVKIGRNMEGQAINTRREYVLGCWAGPEANSDNLFHEMAHLAEREVDKIIERPMASWGFTFGKYWEIAGKYGWEPQTEQSVLREARVWSYQASIMREFRLEFSFEGLVSSAVYLPAFCHFEFNRSKHIDSYPERELESLKILANIVEKQTEVYTFKKFEENWNHRMKALKYS